MAICLGPMNVDMMMEFLDTRLIDKHGRNSMSDVQGFPMMLVVLELVLLVMVSIVMV